LDFLRDHSLAMPNLERGTPLLAQLLSQSRRALGEAAPAPVVAPPALSNILPKTMKLLNLIPAALLLLSAVVATGQTTEFYEPKRGSKRRE